jgi:hypothetical protein
MLVTNLLKGHYLFVKCFLVIGLSNSSLMVLKPEKEYQAVKEWRPESHIPGVVYPCGTVKSPITISSWPHSLAFWFTVSMIYDLGIRTLKIPRWLMCSEVWKPLLSSDSFTFWKLWTLHIQHQYELQEVLSSKSFALYWWVNVLVPLFHLNVVFHACLTKGPVNEVFSS